MKWYTISKDELESGILILGVTGAVEHHFSNKWWRNPKKAGCPDTLQGLQFMKMREIYINSL
jgi:hypothetical protein